MTKQPGVAVGVAAVVLLVALWVSGAGEVWFIHGSDTSSSVEDDSQQTDAPDDEGDKPAIEQEKVDEGNIGVWFDIVATILLVAAALLLLTSFVRTTQRRRRRRKQRRAESESSRAGPSVLAESIVVPPELVEAADDLTVLLQQGTPRNAIVSCWVALEQACAGAGLTRLQSETSVEFTTRVLGTFAVDEMAISRLAELYREARFSRHQLSEQHRDEAVRCLQQLQSRLRSGAQSGAVGDSGGHT